MSLPQLYERKTLRLPEYEKTGTLVHPINWNVLQDPKDRETLDVLESNFWLPEEIAVSNDIKSWNSLTEKEKLLTARVFAGLTLLDTVQSQFGAEVLKNDSETQHESAVFSQIQYMEAVHARSYSNIFSTLMSTEEINDIMEWAWSDEYLRNKQEIILKHYQGDDPYMRKIASVFLESFLFYSGFFWAFYLSSRQKMTNTSTMISLILRDERLSKDHELLTAYGWKNISEITLTDIIAQYDKESGKISFVHPTTVSRTYDTSTYLFESSDGKTKQHVSMNHRMLIASKNTDGSITKNVVPASEITVNKDGYIDGMLIKQTFDGDSGQFEESYVPGVRRLNAGSSDMYAISVPSTFLLTRLNGSVTITGNCIHGYYIGYKFQRMMERLSEDERESYREKAMNLFKELYANELKYTESIYDEVLDTRPGITDEVKKFLRYNGNKALLNLGFEPMFSTKETEVLPSIMTSLTPNSNENHDFFSDKGSSYKRSTVEETSDDDWD